MKYTRQQIQSAVKSSKSYSGVLRCLGIKCAGGSVGHIKKRIKQQSINISHFTFRSEFQNRPKRSPQQVLVLRAGNSFRTAALVLRKAMISSGFQHKCSRCMIQKWNEQKITLQIDHINGNSLDNRIENVRFLCPNCHSQTKTYKSKNTKNNITADISHEKININETFQQSDIMKMRDELNMSWHLIAEKIYQNSNTDKVRNVYQNIKNERPIQYRVPTVRVVKVDVNIEQRVKKARISKITIEKQDLHKLLDDNGFNYSKVGKILGVSNSAIKKHCLKVGIELKKNVFYPDTQKRVFIPQEDFIRICQQNQYNFSIIGSLLSLSAGVIRKKCIKLGIGFIQKKTLIQNQKRQKQKVNLLQVLRANDWDYFACAKIYDTNYQNFRSLCRKHGCIKTKMTKQ